MRARRARDIPKNERKAWDAIATGAPELLDDLDFSRMRQKPSTPKPRNNAERDQVQRPLVVFLRKHLPPGSVVFAITNHARSKAQVFALMRDGMLPGMPDIGIIVDRKHVTHLSGTRGQPWCGFIECKKPGGGTLSDNQKHVQGELKLMGAPVLSECRAAADAIDWLREQGVKI